MSVVKVLGISGSLRKGSFNTLALRAAMELVPDGVELTLFEGLRDIPPYDDYLRTAYFGEDAEKLLNHLAGEAAGD